MEFIQDQMRNKKGPARAGPFISYGFGSAARAARSGSFLTSLWSFNTRVSPFSMLNLGQEGRPAPFGLPVFINASKEADILVARA